MTKQEKELFLQFVYNQKTFMEQDITELQNMLLSSRRVSYVAYLELVLAQNRYDNFCEFVNNVYGILDISSYNLNYIKPKRGLRNG